MSTAINIPLSLIYFTSRHSERIHYCYVCQSFASSIQVIRMRPNIYLYLNVAQCLLGSARLYWLARAIHIIRERGFTVLDD